MIILGCFRGTTILGNLQFDGFLVVFFSRGGWKLRLDTEKKKKQHSVLKIFLQKSSRITDPIGFLRGVVIPLIFPKVLQSFLGILRVPQLPPPFEHLPLRTLQ